MSHQSNNNALQSEYLEAIFRQSGEAMRIIGLDQRILDQNPQMELLSGITRYQALNQKCATSFAHPCCDTKDCIMHRILAGEPSVRLELEMERPDKSKVQVSLTATPLKNAGGEIVGMLEILRDITVHKRLESALRASERRFQAILDSIQSGVVVIDAQERVIVDANRVAVEMIGMPRNQVIGSTCHQFICPAETGHCPIADLGQSLDHSERVLLRKNGTQIPIIKTVVPIMFEDRPYLIESFIDITERRRMEEQLEYLSMHDSLTGLYNRAYFEEEMRRLETGRKDPVTLIIFDVDGLKLVNDTLGHDAGDGLMKTVAGSIREAFREEYVVARVGGDEFAVLLPHTDTPEAQKTIRFIREKVARYNTAQPQIPLSISIGYATRKTPDHSLTDLFKEADNNMHREKLHRRESARSAIVRTLMKALEARDFITEGHADRLQCIVASLAGALGLSESCAVELRLLAQFHDIGKVGIPDHILFKPGSLTPEELVIMRRHSEIGYRIAQSAPDLTPIADWILKHHERWDGKGYPLGLQGEEIPLECRILAIADAFDAMTNDRPYRKAMPHNQAVEELHRCAGTQFDPQLVRLFMDVLQNCTGLKTN